MEARVDYRSSTRRWKRQGGIGSKALLIAVDDARRLGWRGVIWRACKDEQENAAKEARDGQVMTMVAMDSRRRDKRGIDGLVAGKNVFAGEGL